MPIGWLKPPAIPSDLVFVLKDADLWHFGVLTSHMHMVWMRHIAGRLKSDYRYSVNLVYNTFPWPEASDAQKDGVRKLARVVLDVRERYVGATLSDLYKSALMKPDLRKAHRDLDSAVDRLYKSGGFQSDAARAEHLLGLYETRLSPMARITSARRNRAART